MRALRSGLVALALMLLVLAGAGWLAITLFRADPRAQHWLAQRISAALSSPGNEIQIGRIEGTLLSNIRLADVALVDRRGIWASAPRIDIRWAIDDLIAGWLTLNAIYLPQLTIERAPEPSGSTGGSGSSLPLSVGVGRLRIDRLALGASLTGEPAVLTVTGDAQARSGWRDLSLDMSARRIDGPAGALDLRLSPPAGGEGFVLDVNYAEPAGGVLARLIDLPGWPALSFRLEGSGPPSAWQGRVAAEARGLARLDGALGVALSERLKVTLDGGAEITGLLPPALRAPLGKVTTLSLQIERSDDAAVTVTRSKLGAPLGTIELSGQVMPALDFAATATLPRLTALSEIATMPLDGSARISAYASGSLAAPTIAADLVGNKLAAGVSSLENLTVTLTSHPPAAAGAGMGIDLSGSADSVQVQGLPRLEHLSWSLGAIRTNDAVELPRIAVDSPLATIAGQGRYDMARQAVTARLTLTAADLAAWQTLVGREIGGSAALDLTLDGTLDGTLDADLALRTADLTTHQPVLDALLGGKPGGRIHAARRPDGAVALDPIALDADDLTVRGRADRVDGRIAGDVRIALPRLAPLGQAIGSPLQGGATATLRLEQRVGVTTGRLEASGNPNSVPTRLDSRFTLDERSLRLDGTRLDAAGLALTADARVVLASMTTTGSLSISARDLSGLSGLAGMPLAGRLQGRVKLLDERGRQRADLTLDAGGVTVADATIGKATLSGALTDLLGTPRGSLAASVADARRGGDTIGHATFKADGALDQLAWNLNAQGSVGQAFDLNAGGRVARRPDMDSLGLQHLAGHFGTIAIALEQPTMIERRGDGVSLGPTLLDLGKGRIRLDGSRRGAQLAGALEVRDLPLGLAQLLRPGLALDGQLGARGRLAGTVSAPDADLSVTLRGGGLAGHGGPPVEGDLNGHFHGTMLDLDGRIGGLGERPLALSARLPVAYRPDPLSVGLPPNATLSGQMDGTIDLSRALLLAQLDQPVSGRATLALRIAGTIAQPRLDGSAELAGGRYANPALGITLDALNAKLIGRGSRLELASLSASDGGKGSLSGQGAIDFSAAKPAFDGSVQLSSFAIQRDDATAVANGALGFGGGADGGQVSGKVTIDQANITLPDQLPPAIVKIDVVEINGGHTATITPGPTTPQRETSLPVAVSLTIDLPGRIFVRGRGLDSEWRGRLTIQGTADKPSIQGELSLVRGRLALLGRTLTLSDGQINFPGGATLDPILDITATATTTDLTATIKITGRASQPTLTITSDPPMPQDEILAEVLFNKQVTQLSAAEALQLAQGVATLTMGGGGGIVDRIRKATGLDVIDVQSGDSTTGASGSALSVGKYVSDRVFVTATQGLSAASSRAGVEIYLTRQFTVKTDVGAAADSTLGLNWKLDY